ncbi:MAG: MarR family winged helix-turn-helix transcriptional regulator [bacterium]
MKNASSRQHRLDTRIVAGLDKLSLASRILLWDTAKQKSLSPIQIQFLLYLANHPRERRRVTQLAREFGLTKPTVSAAVKSLTAKRLVSRRPCKEDGRVHTLDLTTLGKSVAKRMSNWQGAIGNRIQNFPQGTKETVMLFLMELIRSLHAAGIIKVARMCTLCENFRKDAHPGSEKRHHCALTDTPLAVSDMNIDCTTHQAQTA